VTLGPRIGITIGVSLGVSLEKSGVTHFDRSIDQYTTWKISHQHHQGSRRLQPMLH
jgi:hypothetical protein